MIKANIHEIKARLSHYIARAQDGELVVVCKRNVPVAELRPLEKDQDRTAVLGSAIGQGQLLPSFYEPMTEEELMLWEQGSAPDPALRERHGRS